MKTGENWRARLRYEFDKSMAGGAVALIEIGRAHV